MNLETVYQDLETWYKSANPISAKLHRFATTHLPGGNTRSALFHAPFPLTIRSASGCHITTADGTTLIDFLGEYSAGLYGHSNSILQAEIIETVQNGVSFGGQSEAEQELAGLICGRFAGMDMVRFCNSGTEGSMMAVATAKIWTKREIVVVFKGGYHGGGFLFGSGGHSINVPHEYLILDYNNEEAARQTFSNHGEEIAAVVLEPMLGSGGGIQATETFLKLLRDLTTQNGALLILDEVMTSRLFFGSGIQGELNIIPDLTILGKYIGGGMSFGAFGGRKDIMAIYDPRIGGGAVPHAGTFNNNILTMRAGACGLRDIFTSSRAREFHTFGEKLRKRLNEVSDRTLLKILGCGSIMVVQFTTTAGKDVTKPGDIVGGKPRLWDVFHLEMMKNGIYMARRGYMSLSLDIGEAEADVLVKAVTSFVKRYYEFIKL